MNKTLWITALALFLIVSQQVSARDDVSRYSIAQLLQTDKAKKALSDMPLYFGETPSPKITKTYGEVKTNQKTNAFGKSDRTACEWVMLSAIKALQQRAVQEGMTAIINIRSNYKNNEFSSTTEFECGAGALIAGVALKGDLVILEDK